ncbi:hypothetical protein [Vibrio sp. AND4]|uniref:hypothetical protein n=1 Tax=Vibrio sp. AND4 TaxID=314289 RepID=UPI000303682C|nr:hypothetical protein [Vibrio sp. AND4]
MKNITALFIACLVFSSPISLAKNSAGHVFGAGVNCTFDDGTVKHLPRELCTMYGGTFK